MDGSSVTVNKGSFTGFLSVLSISSVFGSFFSLGTNRNFSPSGTCIGRLYIGIIFDKNKLENFLRIEKSIAC